MRYIIETDIGETERTSAYMVISEILLSRGFPGRIGMDEELNFVYRTDKPLDEETIRKLKRIPGVEGIKELPERRWGV